MPGQPPDLLMQTWEQRKARPAHDAREVLAQAPVAPEASGIAFGPQ
jgi:hypothetical protein